MANFKEALDYYPRGERSRQMELVGAEFKEKGDSVMWSIFDEIYLHGHGYYCEWNDDVALMFVSRPWFSMGVSAVSEILRCMLRRGILNKTLFEKYGILTSKEIQEFYFEAVKRRKGVKIIKEYLLIDCTQISANVNIISLNADIIEENASILKQRKEKKRKEKKKRGNDAPTRTPRGEFRNVLLSDHELAELKKRYPQHYEAKIERLSRYLESTGKTYESHYSTLLMWLEKDTTQEGPTPNNSSYDINELDKIDTLDWME